MIVGNSQLRSAQTDAKGVDISHAEILQDTPGRYRIAGTVDFVTSPALLLQASAHIREAVSSGSAASLIFDLSEAASCNSAALALLLEILKQGKQADLDLKFENMPESLIKIAKAYGIETEIREFIR